MRKYITACMTIIFLLSFINILNYYNDSKHTQQLITQTKSFINSTTQTYIDHDSLLNNNTDYIGWLEVYETNIDYPFVQTKDNKYYLHHSFNKKKSDAGWVFLDYRNDIYKDKNIVIYAHDRKDKTMFGTLKNVFKKDNQLIKIYLKDKTYTYQVFSTYTIKTEDYYITTDFSNKSFSNFIKKKKKRSNHNYNINVNNNDYILTLSTCYTKDKKLVVHAKRID